MADPFAKIAGKAAPKSKVAKPKVEVVVPVPQNAPVAPDRHPKLGAPSRRWTYQTPDGKLAGYVYRFERNGDKEFRPLVLFRVAGGKLEWRWESWPSPRPLYGLDRLTSRPADPVLLCEGEKAADAACELLPGLVAIASPNGSKSAGKAGWGALAGRAVTIWPDADEAGRAYAEEAARLITAAGATSVAIIEPPSEAPAGWDAADALAEAWSEERAALLCGQARPVRLSGAQSQTADNPERTRRDAQRDVLAAICGPMTFWIDHEGEAFASYPLAAHIETAALKSETFKSWISYRHFQDTGLAPSGQALDGAIRALAGRARYEGAQRPSSQRVIGLGGKIVLDLVDRDWRAVEIGPESWQVLNRHDVGLVRRGAMQALPEPISGEELGKLRGFLNVASEDDFILVVGWLVMALNPRGPYPILVVGGEQGSGKSTFTRLIRSLVDPNAAPIRAAPKDDRDLIVAATNAHVIALDNLSKVEPWLSDALCRLSTGGGFASRTLHTDREETVLNAARPIILNGIGQLSDRADLADRAITVRLKTIPEEDRKDEESFLAEWEMARPSIIGTLLNGISCALRRFLDVRLERLPRMADFARWVTAAEPGLGWKQGTFMTAYQANRRESADMTFDSDPVAVAIYRLIKSKFPDGWHGSASELLAVLDADEDEATKRLHIWPKSAAKLGSRVDRAAPLLRSQGLDVTKRHSGIRSISIMPRALATFPAPLPTF